MVASLERDTIIRVRAKNQITIPDLLARELGVGPGDRLFVSVDAAGAMVLRKVPKSYAGAFADLWPDLSTALAELRSERDQWDEHGHPERGR